MAEKLLRLADSPNINKRISTAVTQITKIQFPTEDYYCVRNYVRSNENYTLLLFNYL